MIGPNGPPPRVRRPPGSRGGRGPPPRLGLAQPQVSKHLRVLREVGLVKSREEGRRRIYRLNGHRLKPIHDWVSRYERSWSERFERLDTLLEDLRRKEEGDDGDDE